MDRRHFLALSGAGFASFVSMPHRSVGQSYGVATRANYSGVALLEDTPRGRIMVLDSLSYLTQRPDLMGGLSVSLNDVFVGASFAGRQTFAAPLSLGAKGIVAHAAGVGKDEAGIDGLRLADQFGVAAAAAETMSARMSEGLSLLDDGRIGHVNRTAEALGLKVGMRVPEGAHLLLAAPAGTKRDLGTEGGSHTTGEVFNILQTDRGGIYATWFIALIKESRPNDVFVTGTHCGRTMAEYTVRVRPKGIIANDAGICKDRSGVVGLAILEREGVPAASVAAVSARIGDAMSTHEDGVISEANAQAIDRGVSPGMRAKDAARALLQA